MFDFNVYKSRYSPVAINKHRMRNNVKFNTVIYKGVVPKSLGLSAPTFTGCLKYHVMNLMHTPFRRRGQVLPEGDNSLKLKLKCQVNVIK